MVLLSGATSFKARPCASPRRPCAQVLGVVCAQGSLGNNRNRRSAQNQPRLRRPSAASPSLTAEIEFDTQQELQLVELLGIIPSQHGGMKNKELEAEVDVLLRSRIKQADTGSKVAALLRSAAAQGVAGPKLVAAALDRLKDLHLQRRNKWVKEGSPSIMAACKMAWELGLECLPQANGWMMVSMARTKYKLKFTSAASQAQQKQLAEQQQRVTEAFIRYVERAGKAQLPGSTAGDGGEQDIPRELANFIWATLSNPCWHMTPEQRGALLSQARLQPSSRVQHNTNILVALVRLNCFAGAAAVAPFLEDGTVGLITGRILGQLDSLDPHECQDTLLSVGSLRFQIEPSRLSALLEQLLAVVHEDARPVDVIAKTFSGLAVLYQLAPEKYETVLQLPALRGLCREFVRLVEIPRHHDEWSVMLRACAQLQYNPTLGAGARGERLFDALLAQLPAVAPKLWFLGALDVLMGLGSFYGVAAAGSELAPALRPHRSVLASTAAQLQRQWARHAGLAGNRDVAWPGLQVEEVIGAFAALDVPKRRSKAAMA